MSETAEVLALIGPGVVLLLLVGSGIRYITARWAIHREFGREGLTISTIKPFTGFLDFDSVWRALSSTGYEVTFHTQEGGSLAFCVVRYVPFLGITWAVERWESTP